MAENVKPSGTTIAKDNLKKGLASPAAKLIILGIFVVAIIAALSAGFVFRNTSIAGPAKVGNLGVQVKAPRGETSASVLDAVEEDSNNRSVAASAAGASYVGPFVYASASEGVAAEASSPALLSALRRKAADYDASEDLQARNSGGGGGSAGSSSSTQTPSQLTSGQEGGNYGMSPDAFRQVAVQLDVVGRRDFTYDGLPGGAFSRGPVAVSNTSAQGAPIMTAAQQVTVQAASQSQAEQSGRVVARAGAVCGAVLETSINTDYNIPAFVKLLDCGELTGTRLRGQVSKTPDDFFIMFGEAFFDPSKRLKVTGGLQAVSANIERDGTPGVDSKVDNHWPSRLASSALLALAATERQFLSARGTTSTITPTGAVLTVDGLTTEQKQEARAAAVLEGSFNVITKDVGAGINRQATMTLPKNVILGVQFLSDVKVVSLE